MRAALLTGLSSCCPELWFVAQGEPLRWFGEGEPPRLLRPLADGGPRERLRRGAVGARPPSPSSCPPVLITLELRRLEAEIRRVEEGDAPHRAARLRAVARRLRPAAPPALREPRRADDRRRPAAAAVAASGSTLEAELVAAGHDW